MVEGLERSIREQKRPLANLLAGTKEPLAHVDGLSVMEFVLQTAEELQKSGANPRTNFSANTTNVCANSLKLSCLLIKIE